MEKKIKSKKYLKTQAQSILEYTTIIACIAAALFAMQIYIKRSLQGKLRAAADEIGEQYSAQNTTSNLTQIISNPAPVTINGTPSFRTDPATGIKYEIMEIERKENTIITVAPGSYEETGKLSDEKLFD